MHVHSYLVTAELILSLYKGEQPFEIFRKSFFSSNKKYGSKDRKHITHLCYSYFRLGKAFKQNSVEEKLLIAQFLTSTTSNAFLQQKRPEWDHSIGLSFSEKLEFLNEPCEWKKIFPWLNKLSAEIEEDPFIRSFLKQPELFLRIRPGNEIMVKKKLEDAGVEFELSNHDGLIMPPNFKADELFEIDNEVVVQDLNSQQVLNLYKEKIDANIQISSWDCCAASGGKSILLFDTFQNVRITVSDIRKSILHNLKSRFKRAGIHDYNSFVYDLSVQGLTFNKKFDLVICDAPCSGSGTWSRTPEQLVYFDVEKINHYQQLQKKIVINASGAVKNGGYLLYITCSVFKKENEDVVSYIKENSSLNLVSMNYYKGYNKKADTLFAALLSFDN
jgi:16S rRNA (cytosine967-C5)-methyltransferase